MNVTLSLDEDLVKRIRQIALDKDTTVTGLVREHLKDLVSQDEGAGRKRREIDALNRTIQELNWRIGKRTWTRADLHERG